MSTSKGKSRVTSATPLMKGGTRRGPAIGVRWLDRPFSAKLLVALIAIGSSAAIHFSFAAEDGGRWAGTWATGPTVLNGAIQYSDQTLRQIVHTSIARSQVRVRISNTFEAAPLVVGAAHVALRQQGARIIPESDQRLTFSGRPYFTIPAGALIVSDPVYLRVPPLSDLAVSIYLPGTSTADTTHQVALQTNFVAPSHGDFTGAVDLPGAANTFEWDFSNGGGRPRTWKTGGNRCPRGFCNGRNWFHL